VGIKIARAVEIPPPVRLATELCTALATAATATAPPHKPRFGWPAKGLTSPGDRPEWTRNLWNSMASAATWMVIRPNVTDWSRNWR